METHFLGQVTLKAVLRYGRFFVLVREMNDNKWILPGGRMNVDEDPESGLAREINEELSVDATVGDIISVGAYHGGQKSKTPKLFVFYSAIVSPNQELVTDKKEIVEFALVSQKEELEKYPMHENQRKVIEKFLA